MKKYLPKIFPLSMLYLVVACGQSVSNDPPSHDFSQNEAVQADGSNINGIYAADIWPVNHNLHFKKIGALAITRDEDLFSAQIKIKYSPKDTNLKAAIYTGRRCPTLKDDLNKDAYIDIMEAKKVIGEITIPLDGDLDSQDAGNYQQFRSQANGKFDYYQSASFERMFKDLKSIDQNPADDVIKLGPEEGLTFPGRIIVIQGLSSQVKLPSTVASAPGTSPHDSIPVACAVLWKVPSLPTELTPDGEFDF